MTLEPGPVWHVIVLEDGQQKSYWHRSKADVLASIEITWSQLRDQIKIIDTGSIIRVYPAKDGGDVGPCLLEATLVHTLPILDGPTHY